MTYTATAPDAAPFALTSYPTPEAAASACLNTHSVAYVFNARGHLTAIYSGTPDQLHAHPIPRRPIRA